MKAWLVAATLTIPFGHSSAPVYSYLGDGVLQRTGTFIYKTSDMTVLYCISQPPRVTIQCVVHTPSDRLVLVETEVSEHDT